MCMYLFTHTTKASTCHSTYVEVREHLWVSVLPFHHVGLRDGTHQAWRQTCFCPVSHFSSFLVRTGKRYLRQA